MSPSTSSSTSNTHEEMAIDRHESARATFRALLLEEVDTSIFVYHEKRRMGLIPQNEEPRWGYEDPRHRQETHIRHNGTHVAQSFFEVDWNKGFTGRGVDARYDQINGDYRLRGPKGETMKDLVGAEAPTSPEVRFIWRAVDKGDDDGIDPFYRGPPIDWDEDTSWSDVEDVDSPDETKVDEEIGPFDEIEQRDQLDASDKMRNALQDVAAQAFRALGDDAMGPLNERRQEAELDSTGEMRDVLMQIVDEGSQTPYQHQAMTKVPASLESSPEPTKQLGTKRDWASPNGPGHDAFDESSGADEDKSYRGQKRIRIWHADEADTLGEVKDIIGDISDEDAGASPLPEILQKREGNSMHNDLVDAVIDVRQNLMNIAKRKAHGSQMSNAIKARDQIEEDHRIKDSRRTKLQKSTATKASNDTGVKPIFSNSKGMKRWRRVSLDGLSEDNSSDEEWQPRLKRHRVRLEQPGEALGMMGQESDTSDDSKGDNSSNDVGSSETDASSTDAGPSKLYSDIEIRPMRTKVRPTFDGCSVQYNKAIKKNEGVPDYNEAGDIVVTCVRTSEFREHEYPPGLSPCIEPEPRSWTEEEEEDLRSWVQDHGMEKKWSEIAWCLHRSEDDCQTRYREIVIARNKRAGRDPEAGLPGWVDTELEVTPEEIAQLVGEDLAER